jgi:agarase
LRLAAEKYFQTGHAIIKKYDPHHLILGVRFIGVHSVPREVLETIGRYVDVVSFNAYDLLPPLEALEQTYAIHHKPMLITEFSFKAMDSGLRNTLGQGFLLKTQKDRALWYERYVARLLSSPHLVGFIWYKDVDDQPFEKGENCNYGLMARDGVPYAPFVAKVREVNRRVYPIAAGAREK